MTYRIAIPVDHKWRDLPGYALLKVVMKKIYGDDVHLYRIGNDFQEIVRIKPHIVMLPNLRSRERVLLAYWLKAHGILVGLIPTEGSVPMKDTMAANIGVFTDMRPVDLQFAWNEPWKKVMLEHQVLPEEKIHVCGAPRFDFYKNPWRKLLLTKESLCRHLNLDPSLPIVTWTTNFVHAHFKDQHREHLLENMKATGLLYTESYSDPIHFAEKSFEARQKTTAAVQGLLSKIPHSNFIIKFHPSEPYEYYKSLEGVFKKHHPHVALSTDFYIWDILNNTDLLLQRSCTTGLEAWLFGIPTIETRFEEGDLHINPSTFPGHHVVSNEKELTEAVKALLHDRSEDEKKNSVRKKLLEDEFGIVDGQRSERYAEVIHNFLVKHAEEPSFKKEEEIGAWLKRNAKLLLNARYSMKKYLRKGSVTDYLGRRDKHITLSDVQNWDQKISTSNAWKDYVSS